MADFRAKLPQVPYGAVYFRKSNPPREDWTRDYGIASSDGLNTFRHWFMWSAIERAPGKYDWDDCDRQLDLAAENGMATVIAEFTMASPDWLQRKLDFAHMCKADGTLMASQHSPSVAVGGFGDGLGGAGPLTLNAPEVHEAVMGFLTELAGRYRGHPGLLGYDVNNEVNYSPDYDFSKPTAVAFRVWLREKYGTLDALAKVWHRYSYAEWDDIMPPRQIQPYSECLDWLRFREDNFYGHVQDKIDTIRAVDPDAKIISHGIAGAVTALAGHGCNDWRAAEQVEIYGYTWIGARKGNQPWRNFFAGDLIRGAARGKPFWHAERQGGPLWMQPQVLGRDKEDARVATPEDIRLWSLASFAAGARGMMNLRYRPLLNGPLFGAFGAYGMDGSRTPRSEMQAKIGRWVNAPEQTACMAAKPVRGDIGLLMIPEAQRFDLLLSSQGGFKTYQEAMWGAYRAFFDMGVQADWVHDRDIEKYDVIYAPYPIMMPAELAGRLAKWVADGGRLISEACPGYFGDDGRVGMQQPNNGLDAVFGVVEDEVEFMPDIGDRIRLSLDSDAGATLHGAGFLQSYSPKGAEILGHFEGGRVAVTSSTHGKGRTLLVGTHMSAGHFRDLDADGAGAGAWFQTCVDWAGITPKVHTGNKAVQGRLHQNGDQLYLWLINPTPEAQPIAVTIDGAPLAVKDALWGDADATHIPSRDAVIVALK